MFCTVEMCLFTDTFIVIFRKDGKVGRRRLLGQSGSIGMYCNC